MKRSICGHWPIVAVLPLVLLLAASCGGGEGGHDGSDEPCTPHSVNVCSCPGGDYGVQVCREDGTGYDPCYCSDDQWDGTTPRPDGGVGDPGGDGGVDAGDQEPDEGVACQAEGLKSYCMDLACSGESTIAVRVCQGGQWSPCRCQGFTVEMVGAYEQAIGSPSLGLIRNTDGSLRACYDAGPLYDAVRTAGVWQVNQIKPQDTTHCNLAAGSDGAVHMVHYDYSESEPALGDAYYGVNRGAAWEFSKVDPVDIDSLGTYGSIEVDGEGNPHMFYRDHRTDNLRYIFYRNGAWQGPELLRGMHVIRGSLRMKNGNQPALVYSRREGGMNWVLVYAERGLDGTWVVESMGERAEGGIYGSLQFDADGNPAVAYKNYRENSLKLAVQRGGQWRYTIVDRGPAGDAASLAVDWEGNYHISYLKLRDGQLDIEHAVVRDGIIRRARVTDEGDLTAAMSMVLDPLGDVHIVYRMYDSDSNRSTVKHASF